MSKTIDITPTPRILRTLGDIPFDIWQCLAELSDNSLDSFRERANAGQPVANARVDILWSGENTPASDREIVVEDNGPGMSLDRLQNAARAGFSTNDPLDNLGLFGMGFNISTARLGDETIFVSATKESAAWEGIKINFEEMIKKRSFAAPVISLPKQSSEESGTRVIVKQLKNGVYSDIRKRAPSIKKRLEVIYAPIIAREDVGIYLRGDKLRPRPHCIWGEARYVIRKKQRIYAVQQIDRDLGEAWFNISKNRYLSGDESAELNVRDSRGEVLPKEIVKRSRRLKGWVGIQRYSHTDDFGIDFIRNGRKILIADKSLFGFENPDTGSTVTEYPIELGSTMGGRIVGEVHVDYLIPTYQKNSFNISDIAWRLTIEAIRGAGPILPQRRKYFRYDGENTSPLGTLVNAYRRLDPGTKNLSLRPAAAKEFRKKFEEGDPDYAGDDKWYKAAQEAEQEDVIDPVVPDPLRQKISVDLDQYDPPINGDREEEPVSSSQIASSGTTSRDDLINNSTRVEQLCGSYGYNEKPPLLVVARKTTAGTQIKVSGTRMPFAVFQDGIEVDFFYDDSNHILSEHPITPKQLLLQVLAEKFALRDHGVSAPQAFVGLVENHLADERINPEALKERARIILSNIQEQLPAILASRLQDAMDVVREIAGEEETFAKNLLDENPDLLAEYQERTNKALEALAYVPSETLVRLVERMPEEFLDGEVFTLPYKKIGVSTEAGRDKLRKMSVDKIVSYLRDIDSLVKRSDKITKYELIRYSNTISILENRLA